MKYGYKKVRQRLRWLRWLLALAFPLLILFTIFGEGGIIHNYVLNLKLNKLDEAISYVDNHNIRLQREIRNTLTNEDYAQIMRTRQALVAPPGSVIYRFSADQRFISIGQTLHSIDEESTKNLVFASFLGEMWSD